MRVTPDDIISAIEQTTLQGRSKQTVIGPSEVGITCQRCLARKLAEVEKGQVVSSWRTTIGRAVHEMLEHEVPPLLPPRAVVAEGGLLIHEYKNLRLAGHSDLFAPNDGEGVVMDYKVVGDDTLEAMRRVVAEGKPGKPQYIIQGHLYGLGWEKLGYVVKRVCILYLPANKGDLRRYHVKYEYDYSREAAAAALAHIEGLIDKAELIGWERVIRMQDPERGCLSCPTYAGTDNPQNDFLALFPSKM